MQNACAEEVHLTQVKEEYYPEVDALIKRLTGASRTHIMQHGLRRGKVEKRCALIKQSKAWLGTAYNMNFTVKTTCPAS
jgi:hypothetical protein